MTLRACITYSQIVTLTLATTACSPTIRVAPVATPDPAMPGVAAPDVSVDSGLARVAIGTDVPASVARLSTVAGHRGPYLERTLLCSETPCAPTLPYGDYELEFTGIADAERTSTAIAHVNASTVVLNHALGRRHHPHGQGAGTVLVVIGLLVMVVGVGVVANANKRDNPGNEVEGGGIATAVGLGITALGAIVDVLAPTTEQPGATREWTPSAHVAGGSVGVRF